MRFVHYVLLLLTLLAGFSSVVRAQDVHLTGQVVEAEGETPLPGANVFFARTTIGAATDAEGRFTLTFPPNLASVELVVSMVGFESYQTTLNRANLPSDPLRIVLAPRTMELDEVEITAPVDKAFQENLRRFESLIFSTSLNGADCRLLNPEVLTFQYDPTTDMLWATAYAPLAIENLALGYTILIHDASLSGNEGSLQWQGQFQFQEMTPKNKRQRRTWARNRRNAYRGSTRHFLAALAADRVNKEGFDVFQVDGPGFVLSDTPLFVSGIPRRFSKRQFNVEPTGEDGVFRLQFRKAVFIQYQRESEPGEYALYQADQGLRPGGGRIRAHEMSVRNFQNSWLVQMSREVFFDDQGHERTEFGLMRYGYWAWERLGERLPHDYTPN